MTDDAVYLPVKDSILKLDLEQGRELSQVGVALTSDEPVGNLFSDGEKLWVVGAGRVYAMTTLEHRLAMLAEQIAAGDAEAQLNRMRLYFKQNQPELALADLRGGLRPVSERSFARRSGQATVCRDQRAEAATDAAAGRRCELLTELFVAAPRRRSSASEAEPRRSDLVGQQHQRDPAAEARRERCRRFSLRRRCLTEDYLLTAATYAVDAVGDERRCRGADRGARERSSRRRSSWRSAPRPASRPTTPKRRWRSCSTAATTACAWRRLGRWPTWASGRTCWKRWSACSNRANPASAPAAIKRCRR